jgi:hypothetical protein
MLIKIADYKTIRQIAEKEINISDIRRDYRIAVIDDEPFAPLKVLGNNTHKYDITQCPDPTDLAQLNDYRIILCDIKGVGMHFGSDLQGAYLIKEIRQKFPYKTIISYTGETWNQRYNEFLSQADDSVDKDAQIEEWVNKLDLAIKNATMPTMVWRKVRKHLISQGVDTYEILKLEDAFVNSINTKNEKIFRGYVNTSSLPDDLMSAPALYHPVCPALFSPVRGVGVVGLS